ncbi:hypothetical protein N7492_004802 [Penicillium capsulatum]|uniref:Parasitic phase-specific protein PSP-1 n=1 Tax=Penicillium capsulatum TaxID=69766 RepID=A0A9W9LQD3_9EURO|nr:hypothetical protein N7492_004802 [Penicillium capsulatum]KAJ6136089.1 hypothetical protein N7512_001249 [Penicillium capsulatum]
MSGRSTCTFVSLESPVEATTYGYRPNLSAEVLFAVIFELGGIYYLSLKQIVLFLGPESSRLPPHLYPWIFVGRDNGSILLQAAGGGVASSADETNPALRDTGTNIMIAGIASQVVTMTFCGLLGIGFAWRVFREARVEDIIEDENITRKETRRFHIFCVGEVFAYATILIRCIYRIPEMAGGWGNPSMRKEVDFLVLDGM